MPGRMRRDIGNGAVRGVIVRVLHGGTPLQVHLRLGFDLHPGRTHLVGHDAAPVARTLAHLIRQVCVGGAEQLLHALIGAKGPHAAGAAHDEHRLASVFVDDLAQALGGQLERLIQCDAHPARVVRTLRVRALHRIAHAIGMIRRLHGCLGLRAAMPAALGSGFVAFDLDRLAILNRYPHAAFDLAACSAAGANVFEFAGCRRLAFGKSLHRGRDRRAHRSRRARDSQSLQETAARHG